MKAQATPVGSAGFYRSIRLRSVGSDLVERLLLPVSTWILIGAALVISAIPHPTNPYPFIQVCLWALPYVGLSLLFYLARGRYRYLYDRLAVRESRIHLNIIMISALVWISGGLQSPFWPFYVLPILGAIIYSDSLLRPIAGAAEVIVAYAAVCFLHPGGQALLDWSDLVMNTTVLAFITFAFLHLVRLVQGHARFCLEAAQSIQELARNLDLVAHPGELAQAILKRVVTAFDAEDGAVMLVDRQGDCLELWGEYSALAEGPSPSRFALGEGIAGQVAVDQQPRLVVDASLEHGFLPSPSGRQIGSLVTVPIISQGRTLGVLSLDSPERGFFTQNDACMLQAYAATVADKLARAKLLRALRFLWEGPSQSADAAFGRILDALVEVLPCDSATLFLLENEIVRAQAVRGHPHAEDALRLSFSLDEDALFRTILEEKREWLILDNAQEDERFRRLAGTDYVGSWLGVPLVTSGRVVGFLSVDNKEPGSFTESDAQTAAVFAGHAAATIQDIRLLQDRQRRSERLQALYEATQAMVSRVEIEPIGQNLVTHLRQLFDARAIALLLNSHPGGPLRCQCATFDGEMGALPADILDAALDLGEKMAHRNWDNAGPDAGDEPADSILLRGERWPLLAASVAHEKRVLGALVLLGSRQGHFSSEDRQFLEAVASSLAIALHNAALITELTENQAALHALHEGSIEISSHLADRDLLASIIDRAAQLVGASGGAVYLLDDAQQCCTLAVSRGLPADLVGESIPLGESVVGQAIRQGRPKVVADYQHWEHRLGFLEPFNLTAVVGVPMFWGKKTLGAIAVHHVVPGRAFSEEEASLLQAFASHAATVIVHSQTVADLAAKSSYLEELIQHALDAIIAVDSAGGITEFNAKAERLLGYGREEALGMPVHQLYAEGRTEAHRIKTLLETGGHTSKHRTMLLTRQGQRMPILLSAVALPDGGGVGFFDDLSDLENARIETALLRGVLDGIGAIDRETPLEGAIGSVLHSLADALRSRGLAELRLYFYDQEREDFQMLPSVAGPGLPAGTAETPISEPLLRTALGSDGPLFAGDRAPAVEAAPGGPAVAACPLRDGPEPVGVLLYVYEPPHSFGEAEKRLLATLAELTGAAVAKVRLYDQARAHARRLERLNEVGQAIGSELELPTLLDLTTKTAGEVFSADAISLMLWDERKENLVIRAAWHLSAEYAAGQRISRATVEQKLREEEGRDPLYIKDLRESPLGQRELVLAEDLCSVLIARLLKGTQLIGVLNIYSRGRPRRFSAEVCELARAFATQAAAAINNAQLYAQQAEAAQELKLLTELAGEIGAIQDEGPLLERAAQLLGQHIDRPLRIGLLQGTTLVFKARHSWGFAEATPAVHAQGSEEGICGEVLRTGKAALAPDLSGDVRCVGAPPGVRAEAVVPLTVGEERLGVLDVYDTEAGALDADDLRVLRPVASQIAVALKYASAFRNECALAQLDLISQIGNRLVHRVSNIVPPIAWAIDEVATAIPADAARAHKQIEKVKRDTTYLTDLARELRRIALAGGGEQRTPVDVNGQLEGALQNVQLGDVVAVREYSDALPPVKAHPMLLRDVFLSMVQNGIAAMEQGGELTLRTRATDAGSWVEIEVEDTGCGMSEAEEARLFTPYFSPKRRGEGLGMALWLAKILLQAWGGDIRVIQTAPDQGTTFLVRLPACKAGEVPAQPEASPHEAPATPVQPATPEEAPEVAVQAHILVVDDADTWRSTLECMLQDRGHLVHTAASYSEAIEILRTEQVDVAVLDIRLVDADMGNKDGLRLASEVVARNPHAAVILLTGFDVPQEARVLEAQGTVLAVVLKEPDKSAFDAALDQALRRLERGQVAP